MSTRSILILSTAWCTKWLSSDWVKAVFPSYEKLLKDETFAQLLEAHKACFDKLVLILDLQGETHLLYEDGYTSNLLRKTNNYDQEFADSLESGHATSDKPTLSKAEQLLLNKTSIGFLQECHKLCQISKDLANKQSDLDNFLNEQTGNFIALKTHFFSKIYNLYLLPIRALSQNLMLNLDNVPEDLKQSVGFASDTDPSNKVSNLRSLFNSSPNETINNFYKCVYETVLAMLAKDINSTFNAIIPYLYLDTKQDFTQSLPSLTLLTDEICAFKDANYIIMTASKRLLQSYDYDEAIQKQISQNTLFVNSALCLMLLPFSACTQYIMIALVKNFVNQVLAFTRIKQVDEYEEYFNIVYSLVHKVAKFWSNSQAKLQLVKNFVNQVLAFTRIKQVDEYEEYFNIVYSLVHKVAKFWSNSQAKLQNLYSLAEQNNAMLCEQFEYKEYLTEITDMLSISQNLCSKYMSSNKGLKTFNSAYNLAAWLSLYQDLLENAPKVLQCIDVRYFKNLGTSISSVLPYFNKQDYISVSDSFLANAMEATGERLTQPELSVVKHFFGEEIASIVEEEELEFYEDNDDDYLIFSRFFGGGPREKGLTKTNMRLIDLVKEKMHLLDELEFYEDNDDDYLIFSRFFGGGPREKGLTKTNMRLIDLVKEKMHLLDDVELHQLLNLESQKIATQIVDSSTSSSTAKAKAKVTKSKAAAATKSKAQKAATKDTADADVIIEPLDAIEAEAKPKAKTNRSKAKKVEAIAVSEAESKPKSKSATKATATKSRAKKVAAVDSTETKADEDAEAKPKKKAATARTTSKASASTRAKKSTAKS